MSVQLHLNLMTEEINQCLSLASNCDISWKQLAQICTITSAYAQKVNLSKGSSIEHGRYLIFSNNNFNVQLDIFSSNYRGAPHNHSTWGVMCVITGALGVTDYILREGSLSVVRASILTAGAVSGFSNESDWHSTETFCGERVASFHIYGNGYDMNYGYRFSDAGSIERYRRGAFIRYSDISEILDWER